MGAMMCFGQLVELALYKLCYVMLCYVMLCARASLPTGKNLHPQIQILKEEHPISPRLLLKYAFYSSNCPLFSKFQDILYNTCCWRA